MSTEVHLRHRQWVLDEIDARTGGLGSLFFNQVGVVVDEKPEDDLSGTLTMVVTRDMEDIELLLRQIEKNRDVSVLRYQRGEEWVVDLEPLP